MIELVFTLDYEIYGNGIGSLKELVYEPATRLIDVFKDLSIRFVAFIEAAELEMIDEYHADPAINIVRSQISDLYKDGFEIGLHLHPQWYNAKFESRKWELDYSEYNLCVLPHERIIQIIDKAISYMRQVLSDSTYTPMSFRAGNWLFQPTKTAAAILAERGIKVDSSVFKGGRQRQYGLDYRGAIKNGYYWKFKDHVDKPEPDGKLIEIPIFTQMVPTWNLLTAKRMGVQRRASPQVRTTSKLNRFRDLVRFKHPLKLDFCRMTLNELINMVDHIFEEDNRDPQTFRPIVAIGHTKDMFDIDTIRAFLYHLMSKGISISTLKGVYPKCT